jgi:hypothetical protein
MARTVSSRSAGSAPVARFTRISSTFRTLVYWNGRTFQKRSGVGPSLSSVGSKMKWNQRCASAKRWLRLNWIPMVSGTWKKSSQL